MTNPISPRLPDLSDNRQLIVRHPDVATQPRKSNVIASKIDNQREKMGGVAPKVFEGEVEDAEDPKVKDEPIDAEFSINASPPSPISPPISPKKPMASNAPKNAPSSKPANTAIWSSSAPARTVADIQKRSAGSAWQALKAKFLQMRGVKVPDATKATVAPAAAPSATQATPAAAETKPKAEHEVTKPKAAKAA